MRTWTFSPGQKSGVSDLAFFFEKNFPDFLFQKKNFLGHSGVIARRKNTLIPSLNT